MSDKTVLFTGKFLSLVKEGRWEYADRVNATGAAIIVAITDDRKLLLVEQYRIPVHTRTIEMPAGIIGDEAAHSQESQAEAARRELREETGYDATRMEILTAGPASSGLTSEVVTLFGASGLRRVSAGGGIAHEDITVHEVSLNEVHAWLEAKVQAGLMIEPKVYAGLYFLSKDMKMESTESALTFFAPHLTVRNVLAELEFCKSAFGAVELRRWSNPDGSVHVAEMSIDGALFHLHEEMPNSREQSPDTLRGTTSAIGLFVPDPADTVKRAITAGGRETNPVKDYDYGYRQGTVTDPAGHVWLIQKKL